MFDFNGFIENNISDNHVINILEEKYRLEMDAYGQDENKNISIFKNWIWLFRSLYELEKLHRKDKEIEEDDFLEGAVDSKKIRELFLNLVDIDEEIFTYKHVINFDLFKIYKQSLEIYDQKTRGFQKNSFLQVLISYVLTRREFPISACLKFYSIFKQLLDSGYKKSNCILENKRRLEVNQSEIYELYKRYGELYTVNVMYQLKLSNDLTSDELKNRFNELHLIEQQIVSDGRLLKVLFKLEDDGLHGCFLNCILIYPIQALSNVDKCLNQLAQFVDLCSKSIEIKFLNWGNVVNNLAREDVIGYINDNDKLENFLYWIVGSFYRHDDFFYYRYPLIECDGGFIHKQVLTPWSLNLQSAQLGMKQRILNIGQSELISYISDPKKVWSTSILPAEDRKRLEIDQIVLLELPFEVEYLKQFNGEILYCLEVFHTFLNVGSEPFFFVEKLNDLITSVEPSKLGCQLIYLFNLLCQQPELRFHIKELDGWLRRHFQKVLDSKLWSKLEELSLNGSQAITDVQTLQYFNTLRDLQPDQLSARSPGFNISNVNHAITNFDESFAYKRRTRDAQEYLGGLLKHDQLICRFKFYAEVGNASFLKERETFSVNFTEFLRVHKRSGLLKNLNGYFLIWSNKFIHNQFEKQKVDPYVDIVLLVEPSYGFCFSSFKQNLISAWGEFQGKNALSSDHIIYFRPSGLVSVNLMNSEELLTSTLVHFEKRNTRLKKALLEKLVPYFTYRHFYLPKFYDVKKNKKIKMFSKGSSTSKLH
ncbi:hypothetical protein [Acinetobacter radioresistens]|uniref:hypothetical protein n=1 Tax=Acinetobacter radioresistens TaxID=40216 RepID=UPI00203070F4|nr:hypothetical protein [Acinetobacter radioresistens]MCM1933956.1 hypothetical protein [Acinetobacter radioresistens]MCM1951580.1 hypothetical protein [Acinetobacter radioresistens]MCU4565658.1 hypothetical protein [Acinetobacter radioresistens]MCX0344339.1 hypothetical protein [Acinetobacter radioresistens]